jgi:hypothetical protein
VGRNRGWDVAGSSDSDKNRLGSGHVLKLQRIGSADEVGVGYERKKGVKGNTKVPGLSS